MITAIETEGSPTGSSLEEVMPIDLEWDISTAFRGLVCVEDDHVLSIQPSFRDLIMQAHYGPCLVSCALCRESQEIIAHKCLEFISLHVNQQSSVFSLLSEEREAVFKYAVRHWPDHYQKRQRFSSELEAAPDAPPDFIPLFSNRNLVTEWAKLYLEFHSQNIQFSSRNPLIAATAVGCADLAMFFIRTLDPTMEILTTCLEVAISNGDKILTDLLLANGASSPFSLHLAALAGRLDLISLDGKTNEDLQASDSSGFTPLRYACEAGHLHVVEKLLELGSHAGAMTKSTELTPLHVACQYGHTNIISRLLAENIDQNQKDKSGMTPLHVASKWSQSGAVQGLLNSGNGERQMYLDAEDNESNIALHFAAKSGRFDIVEPMLSYGKQVLEYNEERMKQLLGKRDSNDSTPLYLAAAAGQSHVLRKLLDLDDIYHSRLFLRINDSCYTPLQIAAKGGHLLAVKALLKDPDSAKAQLQIGSRRTGEYPIHLAVVS